MFNLVLAQGGTTDAGSYTSLIFLAVMIGVFWLFLIRPQRQRMKRQQELSESIAIGDEVRTLGGIHGRVVELGDDSVVLEVEQGRLRVARRAIGARVGESAE